MHAPFEDREISAHGLDVEAHLRDDRQPCLRLRHKSSSLRYCSIGDGPVPERVLVVLQDEIDLFLTVHLIPGPHAGPATPDPGIFPPWAGAAYLSIGTPTRLPHSVQLPS